MGARPRPTPFYKASQVDGYCRQRGRTLQARDGPRRGSKLTRPQLRATSRRLKRLSERLPPRALADVRGLPGKVTACLHWRRAGQAPT